MTTQRARSLRSLLATVQPYLMLIDYWRQAAIEDPILIPFCEQQIEANLAEARRVTKTVIQLKGGD